MVELAVMPGGVAAGLLAVALADGRAVMRWQKILLIVMLAAAMMLPEAGQAQFSPRGIIGAFTHPLREMLGRFGHLHRHRSREASAAQEAHQTQTSTTQFGDSGPAGWSSAYEDIVGFAFWPGRYAAHLRAHGFDVVADALTGPGEITEVARSTTGAAVQNDSNGNPAQGCFEPADSKLEWPASQIEQATKLDNMQRAALVKLRTAVAQSVKTLKAGCRDLKARLPFDRLKATVQELWAVRDAGIYIRAPLKEFYDSLNEEQRKDFAWKQPDDHAKQVGKPDNGSIAKQYQACAAPSQEASERLLRQIDEEVRPSKRQDEAMQALRKTADDMSKLLTAPCAQPIPADPPARLDAANDQLSSLSYVATSMEIALNGFYAQLDDEQKAKFDLLGR